MITSIEIKNINSIKECKLNFEKAKYKYKEDMIFNSNYVNPIGVYGANGSGKSSLLKAFFYLLNLLNGDKDEFNTFKPNKLILRDIIKSYKNPKALNIVKKESGFANKILRPLCAKNMDPTEMELSGLVDREKLLNITGRSRKPQMELAEKWNITEYPSPAGGCKLTEPNYALRLRDLLEYKEDVEEDELSLLRYGRHIRTEDGNKIIVARTKEEGDEIKKFINDKYFYFHTTNFSGALVLLVKEGTEKDIDLAARVAARYSKGKDESSVEVKYGPYGKKLENIIKVEPISDKELEKYMISIR